MAVAGDSVTFETAGGNDVRISYKPLSNFSGDFCSAPAAVEKNIPMRFAGPQARHPIWKSASTESSSRNRSAHLSHADRNAQKD